MCMGSSNRAEGREIDSALRFFRHLGNFGLLLYHSRAVS